MSGDLIGRLVDLSGERDVPVDRWKGIGAGLSRTISKLTRSWNPDLSAKDELEDARAMAAEMYGEEDATAVREAFHRAFPLCESPIEKLLLPWLIAQPYRCFEYAPRVLLPGEGNLLGDKCVAVIPQLPVGRYRADFGLAARRGRHLKFVLVECDGAAFHDGVSDVVRDVNRDVAILANPRVLDIVRLTGSEISASPKAAADKVERALVWCWDKRNAETLPKFEGVA